MWQKAIGKRKAPHAKILAFEEGLLTILVDSSSMLYEFSLEKEMTLANGTKVMPDGTMIVKLKDGVILNMKGEALGGK